MCKRNFPYKNKASTGCVSETPQIRKESRTGCVRETPHIKMKPARDVREKLPRFKKKKKKKKTAWDVCEKLPTGK